MRRPQQKPRFEMGWWTLKNGPYLATSRQIILGTHLQVVPSWKTSCASEVAKRACAQMSLTGVPLATMGFASGNKTPSVRPVLALIVPVPQRGSVSHLELPRHQSAHALSSPLPAHRAYYGCRTCCIHICASSA